MKPILEQLIDYYYSDEFNLNKGPLEDIKEYYIKLLNDRNIVYKTDGKGKLIAFIEFFLVNKEQAARLYYGEKFQPRDEDVTSGSICYINDIWINPENRLNGGSQIIRNLRRLAEKLHGKKSEVIFGKNGTRRPNKVEGRYKLFDGGG